MTCAVIDCHIVMAWALDEPGRERRRNVLDQIAGMIAKAPGIFTLEVGNVVATLVKHGKLGTSPERVVAQLWNFTIEVQPVSPERIWNRVPKLAIMPACLSTTQATWTLPSRRTPCWSRWTGILLRRPSKRG